MRNSSKISNGVNRTCPSELELSQYLDCKLTEGERQYLESHIANCRQCLDLLVVAHQAEKVRLKTLSALNKRIKDGLGIKTRDKSAQKWLGLSILFFVLSFIFSRYFLQFLIGSTILALKWIMEGEGARRAILIFKKMQKEEESGDSLSLRSSESKIFHKK